MFYVVFDIENTGNSQIKNQEIRFEFTEGSEIIDTFVVNEQREMEVDKNIISPDLGKNQKIYKIGRLKPVETESQPLGFRFIVKTYDNEIIKLKHYPTNDEDVKFIGIEAKKVSDEIGHIQDILKLSFIVFVILPLLKNIILDNIFILKEFRVIISLLISLITLVVSISFILPRISKFSEAIVNLLPGSLQKHPDIQADKIAFLALEGANVNVEKFTMTAGENTNQIS
ncbi:hypothetical protein [Nostoc sp.]|uniref:hypothetical protein n=1 Tax=Nostoc sp. TaxID=1180 RepID=UPI002FFAAE11